MIFICHSQKLLITYLCKKMRGKKMRTNEILTVGFVSIFLALSFFINCSKKKPIQPIQPTTYYLYALSMQDCCVYVIDTKTDLVVDTIFIEQHPYSYMQLGISPDGLRLHIFTNNPYGFYEINTRTKQIEYKGPNSGTYVTPDGRLIVHPYGGIHFYDAATHQLVHHDTLTLYPFAFDTNSPLVYGAVGLGKVAVFNYQTFSLVKTYEIVVRTPNPEEKPKPFFSAMILSPDSKTLYFTGGFPSSFGSFALFGAYDLINDSLETFFPVRPESEHTLFLVAYLAMSKDGKFVYITDPGGFIVGPPVPYGEIWVFDTQHKKFVSPITTDTIVPPGMGTPMSTCDIEITPDGKKVYVSNWAFTILVIDPKMNDIIDTIGVVFGLSKFTELAIQTKP